MFMDLNMGDLSVDLSMDKTRYCQGPGRLMLKIKMNVHRTRGLEVFL